MSRRPFVLVHGAWHGAWCWTRVAAILDAAGHQVVTPTLDIRSARTGLDSLVRDVASAIEDHDLADIVLVGHSFGGVVTTCFADRRPDRIAELVHLDAVVPQNGRSILDLVDPALAASRRALAREHGGMLPAPAAASFGVRDPDQAAWLAARLVQQPIQPYEDKVSLSSSTSSRPATYIACVDPAYPPIAPFQSRARLQKSWTFREIATGHDAMVTAPALVARELMRVG